MDTHGVIKSLKYRDKLYKLLKMTPHAYVTYTTQQINLTTYTSRPYIEKEYSYSQINVL